MMKRMKLKVEQTATTTLWQRFFIDPNITRNLQERDGTKIYTDGKRGVQIKNNDRYLMFSDPVAQLEKQGSASASFLAGIQFINAHGGWSGRYVLDSLSESRENGEYVFQYRQYFASYPMVAANEQWFGNTRISLKNGTVASFQRPLKELNEKPMESADVNFLAGDDLVVRLDLLMQRGKFEQIYPVYEVKVEDGYVVLDPAWAVEMMDGKTKLIR